MSEVRTSETHKNKAGAAANKPAAWGQDIDLDSYVGSAEEQTYRADPSELPVEAKQQMLEAGVILDDTSQRSGTYIQMDNKSVHSSMREEGVEVKIGGSQQGNVHSHHQEFPMGEVNNVHYSKDKGQTQGDKGEDKPHEDPEQDELYC